MNKQVAYCVEMIESEAGCGSRVDERLYFKTEEVAKQFVERYNAKWNSSNTAPDWYILATYAGECIVPDYVELIVSIEDTGYNLEARFC